MPWFQCEDCGESVKKPKIPSHQWNCRASAFTCIDCQQTFNFSKVQAHTVCMTEDEKYRQGKSKPIYQQSQQYTQSAGNLKTAIQINDDQYGLAQKPPWKCELCNTVCTSRESLQGHAKGTKHQKKLKNYLSQNQTQNKIIQEQNNQVTASFQQLNSTNTNTDNKQFKATSNQNGNLDSIQVNVIKKPNVIQNGSNQNNIIPFQIENAKLHNSCSTSNMKLEGNTILQNQLNTQTLQQNKDNNIVLITNDINSDKTPKKKKQKNKNDLGSQTNQNNLQNSPQLLAIQSNSKGTNKKRKRGPGNDQDQLQASKQKPRKQDDNNIQSLNGTLDLNTQNQQVQILNNKYIVDANDITPQQVQGFATQKLVKKGDQGLSLLKLASKVSKLFGYNPKESPDIKKKVKNMIRNDSSFIFNDNTVRLHSNMN